MGCVWRAVYRNQGRAVRTIGMPAKARLFKRTVNPTVSFRTQRWRWSATTESKLDVARSKMFACLAGIWQSPAGPYQSYMRGTRTCMTKHGITRWSHDWVKRSFQWLQHLRRHPSLPASNLLKTQVVQTKINQFRRTMQALNGRDSSLAARGQPGMPHRTVETIRKMAIVYPQLKKDAEKPKE
jgi:hypothetical protein